MYTEDYDNNMFEYDFVESEFDSESTMYEDEDYEDEACNYDYQE